MLATAAGEFARGGSVQSAALDARTKQREPCRETIPDIDSRLELRYQEFDMQGSSSTSDADNCGNSGHEVIAALQMLQSIILAFVGNNSQLPSL